MPAPVPPRLLAVAADGHVAPDSRSIARRVDERPLAVVRTARLEPRPRSVGHDIGDRREDRVAGLEDERSLVEADAETGTARRFVEGARGRFDAFVDAVVGAQEDADRVAQVAVRAAVDEVPDLLQRAHNL